MADAEQAERESFLPPNVDGLSDLVVDYPENIRRRITDPELHRTYLDGLLDLHMLVEEYRFEALLALTLLRDYRIKRDRNEVPAVVLSGNDHFDAMPWLAEVVVVGKRYAREPPSPFRLFDDPHQQIAGGRIFSRWVAAQLLDSALYRGIAACDRLAILLRCAAGLPVERTRAGVRRQPSFITYALKELDEYYSGCSQWPKVRELADNPLFDFVKQERNGFTHERRRPSVLHGERAILYGSNGPGPEELIPAMDPDTHYALAPAFYNEVLGPAIESTRSVLLETSEH